MSSSAIVDQLGRGALGVAVAYKLSSDGLKKGSLSRSGSVAAFLVAVATFGCSFRCGATLVAFYWTSSRLTRVGASVKATLEEDASEGGNRGATQVLSCSLVAVLVAVARRVLVGVDGPLAFANGDAVALGDRLSLAYLGFFACCAGDTWASEVGVLSKRPPRSIVAPWRAVVPGANGGVSALGLAASAAGGACVGLCHAACLFAGKRDVVPSVGVGAVAGLGGSLLDSLLGATAQATYYDPERKLVVKRPGPATKRLGGGWAVLSNEGVNVVSSVATTIIVAVYAPFLLRTFGA